MDAWKWFIGIRALTGLRSNVVRHLFLNNSKSTKIFRKVKYTPFNF